MSGARLTDLGPDISVGQAPTEETKDPIPADTESLVAWLDERFPEECPRTSQPDVVDACIRRAGIRDLLDFMRMKLDEERQDMLDNQEDG